MHAPADQAAGKVFEEVLRARSTLYGQAVTPGAGVEASGPIKIDAIEMFITEPFPSCHERKTNPAFLEGQNV